MYLSVERLSGPEALADLTGEWQALEAKIFPRTPFTSPLWISLWWKYLRGRGPIRTDRFFCHVVRDHKDRLIAIVPLVISLSPGPEPFRMRVVQFFGADASITEIRGVICLPEHQADVIETLSHYFAQRRNELEVFRWFGMRDNNKFYKMLMDNQTLLRGSSLPDYVLSLPESWENCGPACHRTCERIFGKRTRIYCKMTTFLDFVSSRARRTFRFPLISF